MRALVVYESMFGDTRHVAEAIGAGLATRCDVTVTPVADVTEDQLVGVDLLVAGGPTHVRGMSQPKSRAGARAQAEGSDGQITLEPTATRPGLREWFTTLSAAPAQAAAFDTRVQMSAVLSGRAAPKIARSLRRNGCRMIAEPESFLVTRKTPGLVAGERERARVWGENLAARTTLDPDD